MEINKKKILLATMSMNIGGAETHILELAIGLQKKGMQVVVASNGGVYEKALQENGIKHMRVSMHSKNPLHMIKAYFALRKLIVEEQIDLVHAHARIPAFLISLLHKKMGFPFITTVHGVYHVGFGLKHLTNWGEETIVISEDIKYYLVNHYEIPIKNIHFTINGINTERFSVEAGVAGSADVMGEFDIVKENKHIIHLGRMDNETVGAALMLIEMMPALCEKVDNVDLIIVGGGNKLREIRKKAAEMNARIGRKVVIVTGSRTDVNTFLSLADLVVAISRAALEGMAMGKPVILAGNNGNNNGYMGFFCEENRELAFLNNFTFRGAPPLDAAVLQQDVIRALGDENQEEIAAIARFGQNMIHEYYSVDRMVNDCYQVYVQKMNKAEAIKAAATKTRKKTKTYDVILSGHYGSRNSGDDAILETIIFSLRQAKPDIELLVITSHPKLTSAEYDVDVIGRFRFVKLGRMMRQAKLYMHGGGSIFQDLTSTRSIWYYLYCTRMAIRHGVPVMSYANGLGPINKKMNRKLTTRILNKAEVISLRDPVAKIELEKLHITTPASYVSVDPVIAMDSFERMDIEKVKYLEGGSGKAPYIGLAIGRLKNVGQTESEIAAFCDYLSENYQATIVLIPMYWAKDMALNEQILRTTRAKNVFLLKNRYAPREMIGIIQSLDFLIGTRLHSLVYAARAGTPMFGIAYYDKKIRGFLEYMESKVICDMPEMCADRLKASFDEAWERREEIREAQNARVRVLQDKATMDVGTALQVINRPAKAKDKEC